MMNYYLIKCFICINIDQYKNVNIIVLKKYIQYVHLIKLLYP